MRSRSQAQPAALGTVLQSVGVSLGQGETDAYEVHEYMMSRDAVADLVRSHDLRAVLDRPEADFWARFPRPMQGDSFESLYKAYKRFVVVGYDSQTGISTLRVQAFRASDARDVARALLDGGEALVNRLNDRAAPTRSLRRNGSCSTQNSAASRPRPSSRTFAAGNASSTRTSHRSAAWT